MTNLSHEHEPLGLKVPNLSGLSRDEMNSEIDMLMYKAHLRRMELSANGQHPLAEALSRQGVKH